MPEKTCPMAGTGTEKPKLLKEAARFSRLMPPMLAPEAAAIQAIKVPAAMATNPAGMPPK